MNFLESLWRYTDEIFHWKFWQVFKWITGAIMAGLIIYLIFDYYFTGSVDKFINGHIFK